MRLSPPPTKFRVESHRPPEKGCTKNQWGEHRVHQVEVLDSCHWQADTVEKIRMLSKRPLDRRQGKPLLSRTSLSLSVMKQYILWTRAWSSRKRIRLDYSLKITRMNLFFFLFTKQYIWMTTTLQVVKLICRGGKHGVMLYRMNREFGSRQGNRQKRSFLCTL